MASSATVKVRDLPSRVVHVDFATELVGVEDERNHATDGSPCRGLGRR